MKRFFAPALIAVYLIVSIFSWGWLMLDVVFSKFLLLEQLGFEIPTDPNKANLIRIAFYSLIGGAFGGISYGMMNLRRHTTQNSFKIVYIGDYLFRPFGGAVLAVVVFALIRGGILTLLGANATNAEASFASSLSSFGIGFLTGFSSPEVIETFNRLSKSIFGKKEDKDLPKEGEEKVAGHKPK